MMNFRCEKCGTTIGGGNDDWAARAWGYLGEIDLLKKKEEALKEFMESQKKVIAVMVHDLLLLGVNFDFATAIERWEQMTWNDKERK